MRISRRRFIVAKKIFVSSNMWMGLKRTDTTTSNWSSRTKKKTRTHDIMNRRPAVRKRFIFYHRHRHRDFALPIFNLVYRLKRTTVLEHIEFFEFQPHFAGILRGNAYDLFASCIHIQHTWITFHLVVAVRFDSNILRIFFIFLSTKMFKFRFTIEKQKKKYFCTETKMA